MSSEKDNLGKRREGVKGAPFGPDIHRLSIYVGAPPPPRRLQDSPIEYVINWFARPSRKLSQQQLTAEGRNIQPNMPYLRLHLMHTNVQCFQGVYGHGIDHGLLNSMDRIKGPVVLHAHTSTFREAAIPAIRLMQPPVRSQPATCCKWTHACFTCTCAPSLSL